MSASSDSGSLLWASVLSPAMAGICNCTSAEFLKRSAWKVRRRPRTVPSSGRALSAVAQAIRSLRAEAAASSAASLNRSIKRLAETRSSDPFSRCPSARMDSSCSSRSE